MKKTVIAFFVIVLVMIGLNSFVITHENEYTLIRQFGKVSTIYDEPGAYFKIPFIQSASTLPKTLLIYDLEQSDVITMDKKTMIADSYVLWKIEDPLRFAQTLNSSVTGAESRIDAIVYNAMKNVISSMNQSEVISGRDGMLNTKIMDGIGQSMDEYGIKIISVETKRLDLPPDNKDAVYERMISERNQMAATYIAEGEADAKKIRNSTDMKVAIDISNAEAKAAAVEAEGEAEYMRILAEAYNSPEKVEFYTFVRALDAAKISFNGEDKTIILPAESPIAKIFLGY